MEVSYSIKKKIHFLVQAESVKIYACVSWEALVDVTGKQLASLIFTGTHSCWRGGGRGREVNYKTHPLFLLFALGFWKQSVTM